MVGRVGSRRTRMEKQCQHPDEGNGEEAANLDFALTAHVTGPPQARRLRVRGGSSCGRRAARQVRGFAVSSILLCHCAWDGCGAWSSHGGLKSLEAVMVCGRRRSSSRGLSEPLRIRRIESAVAELRLGSGLLRFLVKLRCQLLLVMLRWRGGCTTARRHRWQIAGHRIGSLCRFSNKSGKLRNAGEAR